MKVDLKSQLLSLIRKWAPKLGISDYKFDFKMLGDRALSGDYARVETDEDTRESLIEFNKDRLSREPDEIEKTVAHELLHVRMNEYAEFVVDLLKEYVRNPNAKRILLRKAERLEHKIVVALTDALVKDKRK